MESFGFLRWKVYDEEKYLLREVFEIYRDLPKEFRYNVGDQLIKSSLSIILNIAEGSGKNSDKELNRFFDIAIGSAYETLANIDILKDNSYIEKGKFQDIYNKIQSIVKQLGGFKKKLL